MSQSGTYGTGGVIPVTVVETLTGNSGGAVGPNGANNINVVGDTGVGITVTGNPGTNTLTITSSDTNPFLRTLTGDSGGAVPGDALGNIDIVGGTGISVAGNPGTNTLTINATATANSYTAVNTTPYVVLVTDFFLGVDCSGGAITIQLPNAPTTARIIHIKDTTGSANTNNITVTTVGGVVTIDGSTSYTMNTQYAAISLIFNGSAYEIF